MKTLLRTVSLLASLAAPAALLVACGSDSNSDLDLESLPLYSVEDEKADKAGSTASVVWVRPLPGPIACIVPPCPVAEVRKVNSSDAEPIYRFDWRGLKLTDEQVKQADAKRADMLLSGKFTSTTAYGQKVTVLQVSRANLQVSARSSDNLDGDRYFSVQSNKTVCVKEPCPTLTATPLNLPNTPASTWTKVDLSRMELTTSQANALNDEIKAGSVYLSVTSAQNQVAQVSQAFRPFTAATLR